MEVSRPAGTWCVTLDRSLQCPGSRAARVEVADWVTLQKGILEEQ